MELPAPSKRQIIEFTALYEQKFGVQLTSEEATDVATRFLQLYWLLTQPKGRPGGADSLREHIKRRRRKAKSQSMKRSTKLIKH